MNKKKAKGIILAGGLGTRLLPLTLSTNKHLLPIYNQPMIFYPIQTLLQAGITEIMVVVSGPHAGSFVPVLKNGEDFGGINKLVYAYQSKPDGGIADALSLAENFLDENPAVVVLGDNTTDANISQAVKDFETKINSKSNNPPLAKVFLKHVPNPQQFGVATIDQNKITEIEEKPKNPKTDFAVVGLYLYDQNVFKFINQCKPSERGELEITDVNNMYIKHGRLEWSELDGFWQDAGSFENLFKANRYWAAKAGIK